MFPAYPEPKPSKYGEAFIRAITDWDNEYGIKFWGMGFKLLRARIERHPLSDLHVLIGDFFCACGTPERFSFEVPDFSPERAQFAVRNLNVYAQLHRFGSMSKDHLLKDGYSPEIVESMMKHGANPEIGREMAGYAEQFTHYTGPSMELHWSNHAEFYARFIDNRTRDYGSQYLYSNAYVGAPLMPIE